MKKAFLVLFAAAAFNAFAQNGVIKEMAGEVELKAAGASVFTAAKTGDTIAPDTIVSTGFKSTAIITVGSSTITVRPLTRLSLTEIRAAAGSEKINVNLQTGRLRVDVKPPAGTTANFTVQSPSATASVRGTSFDIDTNNLTVNEGKVAFSGKDGVNTFVLEGFHTQIGNDRTVVNPYSISNDDLTAAAPVGTELSGESAPNTNKINRDASLEIGIYYP